MNIEGKSELASQDSIEVPENQNASGEMRAKAPSLSTTAIPKDSSLSADPPVSERTRLIREQQRSGASEVSAVMVSPLEKVASVTEFFERHSEASAVMLTRHTQAETALAFKVLKESLQLDSNYAWSWHCNIAMAFYDEARRLDESPIQISALHEVANNAAARFMGLCFEIDVTKSSEWASLFSKPDTSAECGDNNLTQESSLQHEPESSAARVNSSTAADGSVAAGDVREAAERLVYEFTNNIAPIRLYATEWLIQRVAALITEEREKAETVIKVADREVEAIRERVEGNYGYKIPHYSLRTALDDSNVLLATCDSLRAERDSLREALEEVLRSGVEFDDPRVNYVIMQVDRDTLTQARAALAVVQKEKS